MTADIFFFPDGLPSWLVCAACREKPATRQVERYLSWVCDSDECMAIERKHRIELERELMRQTREEYLRREGGFW